MSATKYLYGASVSGIQKFIFQTNELREIVGASELVEEICTTLFMNVSGALEYDPAYILHAAGNIKYLFEDKDKCEHVVRNFPRKVTEFAPGIEINQAVVEMRDDDFASAVDELEKLLRAQRNKPMRSATLGLMGIERSRTTGLPVVGYEGDKHIDETTRAKLFEMPNWNRKRTTKTLCEKSFGKEHVNSKNIPFNIGEIKGNNDWIAVIHADGNGLGQVVQKVGHNAVRFKNFSENLDRATTSAAISAFEVVKDRFSDKPIIPIRPIVLGGDDLTVICRADIAIDYVKTFIDCFEKNTSILLTDDLNEAYGDAAKDGLTACVGIAFVKSSYPFYYGYELAETLCSQAKKDAKNKNSIREGRELPMSCIMFHKVQDSFVESWNEIAARELQPKENLSFQFGPYYLKEKEDRWTIGQLTRVVAELKDYNAIKSSLRNWMSLLHEEEGKASQHLSRLKEITNNNALVRELTSVSQRGDIRCLSTYDVLAIHTILNQKTN